MNCAKLLKTLPIPVLFTGTFAFILGMAARDAVMADDSISPSLSERFEPKLERSFSTEEAQLLIQDFENFARHRVNFGGDRAYGKVLKTIFGGASTQDILNFLDERIRYLYPPSVDPRVIFSNKMPHAPLTASSFQALELATNLSAPLWFAQVQRPDKTVFLRFNDQNVTVDSTRIGAVQLKQTYFKLAGTGRFSSLYRIAKLVHEARHSDCSGGLSDEDAARVQNHLLPLNFGCGHSHVVCPETYSAPDGATLAHPYAKLLACDQHDWGAYTIEAAFAIGLKRDCTSCTETERQEMQALIIDNSLRMTKSTDSYLLGKQGLPNMASRTHGGRN